MNNFVILIMEVNEPAVAYGKRHFSIEEYLEMENAATEKHEYYQGEIFAMSGAKLAHNIVTSNLHVSLGRILKGKPCRPFGSDLRIHIEKNTLFTYPDISIICGEPKSLNDDDMNFLNSSVIIEVALLTTRERKARFKSYRDIPTLKEYIMVDTTSISIEDWFINSDGNWELKEYDNITHSLELSSIQVSVELREIYEGTEVAK